MAGSGVLFAVGDVTGGMVAWIENGTVQLFYNGFGDHRTVRGPQVPAGEHVIRFAFEATGERRGRGRLLVDDVSGEWAALEPTFLYGVHEGLDIGLDRRGPVSWDRKDRYGAFRYDGVIRELFIISEPFAPDSTLQPASSWESIAAADLA